MSVDLKAIDPKVHAKYSPNLFAWLKKETRKWPGQSVDVFRSVNEDGEHLHIGVMYDGELLGSRLWEVLCKGARTQRWSYAMFRGMERVENFWERYARDGRCVLDPKHTHSFVGDEERYVEHGNRRRCMWCGTRQRRFRWIERRKRERWDLIEVQP